MRVDTRIGPGVLQVLVPPLLLQPLVENAIRHGIAPRLDGGLLALHVEGVEGQLRIELRNDGVPAAEAGRYQRAGRYHISTNR